MNYVSNLLFNSKTTKTLLILLGFIGPLLLIKGTVGAVPPVPQFTLPNAGDFSQTNHVYLIVANRGSGYTLNAPTSTVRIYTPNRTGQITIFDGAHCPTTGGPDRGASEAVATTRFYTYVLAPDFPVNNNTPFNAGNRVNLPSSNFVSSDAGCGSYTFSYSIPASVPPHVVDPTDGTPYDGLFGLEFIAAIDLGAPGWNMFKLQMGGSPRTPGRISYYAGSGDEFGIKADSASPTNPGNFRLGFAANCNLNRGDSFNRTLRWYDADAGQSNQPGPITSLLYEYDWNGNQTSRSPITINVEDPPGDGQSGGFSFDVRGHHKYEWVINGIYTGNGWQFELPYDSYNTLINFNSDCPAVAPAYRYSCSVLVSPATTSGLAINAPRTVTVTMTNRGTRTWTPADSPATQIQRRLSNGTITYHTVTSSTSLNGDFSRSFTETAPSTSPAIKSITYQMWRSTIGAMPREGPQCTVTLSTGSACPPGSPGCPALPPGGSGTITAGCATTTVTANVPATWHRPIPPAAPPALPAPYGTRQAVRTLITKVPAAVRITDNNTGATYTYLVPGGIDNGGTRNINTFDMWSDMWPHGSYTLELFLQGSGSPPEDSPSAARPAVYDDNGYWNPTNNASAGNFYYSIVQFGGPQNVSDCLDFSECNGPSSVDLEPGQVRDFTYTLTFRNHTTKTYPANDTNGYYFRESHSGGFEYVGGSPPPATAINPGNPGPPVTVTLSYRVNYTGSFGLEFWWRGTQMSFGNCGTSEGEPGGATPRTRPFFQEHDGDLSTGGAFRDVSGTCATGWPIYVSPAASGVPSSSKYAGGVRAFYTSGLGGSLSEFGTYALGLIARNDSALIGFGYKEAFSNNAGVAESNSGGYLNSVSQAHCVQDYFTNSRIGVPIAIAGSSVNVGGLGNAQYSMSGDPITLTAATIPVGRQTTLYVDGNVLITGNITQDNGWNPKIPSEIPYFTLVVRGNVTMTRDVQRLDGLYIVQPNSSGSGGVFSTCNDFCNTNFLMKGAVIAQHLQLLRSYGTISPDTTASITNNAAEIFQFSPSMVIGRPRLMTAEGTGFLPGSLESLFSLPPVF